MTFEIQYNDSLKIFSKLYVGLRETGKGVPLGFATPYEENAAGLKRQATVDNWSSVYRHNPVTRGNERTPPNTKIVDNVLREGFRITDDIKRVYWGGGNVVWRLHDPLGWEIEIQSSNLMALIQTVGIEKNGVVPGKCIIARDGAHNVLLPESSQEYQDAIKAAETLRKPGKIPMKDRVVGRVYRLQDGTFGTYLGKHWVYSQSSERNSYYEHSTYGFNRAVLRAKFDDPKSASSLLIDVSCSVNNLKEEPEQFEAVLCDYTSYLPELASKEVKYYKSAPLIEALDMGEMPFDAAVALANEYRMHFASSTRSDTPWFAAPTNEPLLSIGTRPISRDKFERKKSIARVSKENEAIRNDRNGLPTRYSLSDVLDFKTLLKVNDKLYSNASRISGSMSAVDGFDPTVLAFPIIVERSRFTNVRLQHYAPSFKSGRSADFECLALPTFATLAELVQYMDELYANGQLVQVTLS